MMFWSIVIGGGIAIYVVFILYKMMFDKNSKIGSCGHDCGSCSSSPLCHEDFYKQWKKDQQKQS